ncbi:hypothetical protein, partial [Thiolapillus sp.]
WITMALCFLQVLREPVVQYLAGSEQRIAPFWNIITWYPTSWWFYLILPLAFLFAAWRIRQPQLFPLSFREHVR